MSEYTSGPWKIERDRDQLLINGKDGYQVTCVCLDDDYGRPEQDKANARLIAAAPEMLEALKEIVALGDRNYVTWPNANAAIAKAEGKS